MPTSPTFGYIFDSRMAFESLSNKELQEMVARYSWLLVRDAHYELEEFEALAESLGEPINYGFGKILDMRARPDADESQFTNASMAIHQDAILNAENRAQYLVFRCLEATPNVGGETLLTDNRAFMRLAPAELLEELRKVEFSYLSMSNNYYRAEDGNDEPHISPLTRHPETGEEMPSLALDDPNDPKRNYAASVVGYDPERSAELMRRIDTLLRSSEVMHAHEWQVGDLLILDNILTCHGRNSSVLGTPRRFQRISIKSRASQEHLLNNLDDLKPLDYSIGSKLFFNL